MLKEKYIRTSTRTSALVWSYLSWILPWWNVQKLCHISMKAIQLLDWICSHICIQGLCTGCFGYLHYHGVIISSSKVIVYFNCGCAIVLLATLKEGIKQYSNYVLQQRIGWSGRGPSLRPGKHQVSKKSSISVDKCCRYDMEDCVWLMPIMHFKIIKLAWKIFLVLYYMWPGLRKSTMSA